jgi:hypothetical protein
MLAVFAVCAALGAPAAFATGALALPAGANGYQSVMALAEKQQAAVKSGVAAPGNLHGVPNPTGAAATMSGPQGAGVIKPLSTVGWECTAEGWIQSAYNGLFVSTEVGYGGAEKGMLRARAASVGAWEKYQICWRAGLGGPYAIWSDGAAKFVTAELGPEAIEPDMLRARANSVGAWEEFSIVGGTKVFIAGANGLWVSSEFGMTGSWYGMLRARSASIGQWEEYNTTI